MGEKKLLEMKEEIISFGFNNSLVGILTSKDYSGNIQESDNKIAVICLNAGVIHKVGPNRLYVKFARAMANIGFPCFRFDYQGTGDSGNLSKSLAWEEVIFKNIREAIEFLESEKKIKKFILAGICSGASNAFHFALYDYRIVGIISINDIFIQDHELYDITYSRAKKSIDYRYYKKHMFSLSRWEKLLTGKSNFIKTILAKVSKLKFNKNNVNIEQPKYNKDYLLPWEKLLKRNVKIFHAFSEGSITYDFYSILFKSKLDRLKLNFPITIEFLKDIDHSFTPVWSHDLLTNSILNWLRKEYLDPRENVIEFEFDNIPVENVRKLLVIIEIDQFFIGDVTKFLSKLHYLNKIYPNSEITIIANNENIIHLLVNNKNIKHILNKKIEETDYLVFDLICICSPFESYFYNYLINNYKQEVIAKKLRVYSISQIFDWRITPKFKTDNNVIEYSKNNPFIPKSSIFISEEEIETANKWLLENGLNFDEKLFIYVNSTSQNSKLLPKDTENKLIKWIASLKNYKILMFDLGNNVKNDLDNYFSDYEKNKVIFIKPKNLRESLCVIASDYTEIIFGATTGLLHCASDIYKNLSTEKRKNKKIPLILAYAGKNDYFDYNEWHWWGDSLVEVVMPKSDLIGNKQLLVLEKSHADKDNFLKNLLHPKDISFSMIEEYLIAKMNKNGSLEN